MNQYELRQHDIIKPSKRLKAIKPRNLTNDLTNTLIILFIVFCLFGLTQAS